MALKFSILIVLIMLAGCSAPAAPTGSISTADSILTTDAREGTPPAVNDSGAENDDTFLPVVMKDAAQVGRTYHQPNGNRMVEGQGQLPNSEPIDIPLLGAPIWVVAISTMTGTVWAVTLTDGTVQMVEIVNGIVTSFAMRSEQWSIGTPPLLTVSGGQPQLLLSETNGSDSTHAIPLNGANGLAYIEADGDLVIQQGEQITTLSVDALPDARILVDGSDRLLFLSGPTDRYGHGVLGDRIEASSITLIETMPTPRVLTVIDIAAPDVIEGIAPIWADLNGDGQSEIIVTHSNASIGAWIAVYAESGELLATGPNIGQGSRWRHQLAVAPFGPNGELELVDVLTRLWQQK